MKVRRLAAVGLTAVALSCGTPDERDAIEVQSVTVYCGRSESLVSALFDRFTASTGIKVRVRYGDTAELAATLREEGDATPAELFVSQDAAALGALSDAQRLRALPPLLLGRVAPNLRSSRGDWIALSGRARVVVYNPQRVRIEELPQSLDDAIDPRWRGRFGIAPTNGSFQAHMALVLVTRGADGLRALLDGLAANEPRRYASNGSIVAAVIAGEVDWGLVNHYYLWRAKQENPSAAAENYFMPGGTDSTFVNLAGAGLLRDTPAARSLIEFLLADESQRYFADATFEYPAVAGIPPAPGLPSLDTGEIGVVEYGKLAAALDTTLELIHDSGLSRL